ncbi:MAG: YihY/virulence factor BrkB family protein [Syntrophobacterales bacterium]|jgi:membrane protein|nr:YihY/virulence factor BrkB family protein [Syntrophobacterales bacterium]
MRLIWRSFRGFMRDGGPMLAGAISCFFILAFVPFILLMFSVLGYFIGGYTAFHDFLLKLLSDVFPSVTHQITQELGTIVIKRQIGIITLIVYAFFLLDLLFAVEIAVQTMFGVKVRRPFLKSLALNIVTAILLFTLTFASFFATLFISLIGELSKFFPELSIGWVTGLFTEYIVPVCTIFVVSTLFYEVLPSKRILRHAMLGGLFTTVFIETAKFLFTYYITWKAFRLGAIYGSLTAIVVFLLWIYYAACIFLIGAKLVHNLSGGTK